MVIFTLGGLLAGNRNTNGSFNNLFSNANFWSSLQSSSNAWNRKLNSGTTVNRNTNNKANGLSVRCLKNWLLPLSFMDKLFQKQLLYDLFWAYYGARKNKRNTINALVFEIDYETKLFKLYEDLITKKYEIGPSICFISFNSVKREVFAADFRDRVVHHLVYNYINPIFEKYFINDSYSCRTGKGTSYGIKRLNHFIRSCSENNKQNCYILKLDIKGYFMGIDKNILYGKIKLSLRAERSNLIIDFILPLIHKIIFHEPTKNCIIKGRRENWVGLPKSKSLFFASENKGLPIGNLTSQLFGNIYLNEFDHFIKRKLGCKYYGRYVDDIVIVHKNKECLKLIMQVIKSYLKDNLFLELHPKKVYLQHSSRGVSFLGTFIKPHRIYIKNKTKGNFYKKIQQFGSMSDSKFLASTNSYLGIMANFNTYKLRKNILENCLCVGLKEKFIASLDYKKIILKKTL